MKWLLTILITGAVLTGCSAQYDRRINPNHPLCEAVGKRC